MAYMLPRSDLLGLLPVVYPMPLISSPFFWPPTNVVGSPLPHVVASDEMASPTNAVERMLASAAAAVVSDGAVGGADPAPGLPQLYRPPVPLVLTSEVDVQLLVWLAAPELPQSKLAPDALSNAMFPSTSSQDEGAAAADRGAIAANADNTM